MMGIYKINNKINSKIYIGSSNNITYRWSQHINDLFLGKHFNMGLQKDYDEYGINVFTFEILEVVLDIESLKEIEGKYIVNYESYIPDKGYNKRLETCKELAELKKEIVNKKEEVNLKTTLNEETIKKISNNLTLYSIDIIKTASQNLKLENSFSCSWFEDKHNQKTTQNLLYNYFQNIRLSKIDKCYWTTYRKYKDSVKGKGFTKGYVDYDCSRLKEKRNNLAFVSNPYPCVTTFDKGNLTETRETFVIETILNWIVNVSDMNKEIKLFIPSIRTYNILINFLSNYK